MITVTSKADKKQYDEDFTICVTKIYRRFGKRN